MTSGRNESRKLRETVQHRVAVTALLAATLVAGCGNSTPAKPSASDVQDSVRPGLRKQLHDRGAGLSSLTCVVPSTRSARCIAKVTFGGARQTVGVDVTIDPDTGKMIWETTQ